MQPKDKPALIVIDMVKDNFDDSRKLPITPLARKAIGPLNQLSRRFRKQGWPVVFATDAFQPDDFIFQTELELWLRERGVTLCAVGGISTHFSILLSQSNSRAVTICSMRWRRRSRLSNLLFNRRAAICREWV